MELGFEESATPFDSGSQNARVWSETWVARWFFCPGCGAQPVERFAANRPVADFHCPCCQAEFELKSQKGRFGRPWPTAPTAPCWSGWRRGTIPTWRQ